MAVTAMFGFEAQEVTADGGFFFSGTASYNTATKRTGAAAARCNPASGASGYLAGLSGPNYMHFAVNIASLPSVARTIASQVGVGFIHAKLTSTGNIAVYLNTTLIGTSSTALSTGAWYWIGLRQVTGTSVVFLQIDGTAEVTGTATVTSLSGAIGFIGTEASAVDAYFDDVIFEDAGFLAPSKVDIALPISDNGAHTGWQAGAGGATNLWDGVNNTPPAGVASASETDVTNIEAIASTAGSYVANLETYTTLGLVSGDTVLAVQSVIRHGEDITTGTKNGTLGAVSNPTISDSLAFVFGTDGGAHAAESGANFWVTKFGTLTTSPSVTLGTSPTLTVTRASETRVGCIDFMGLFVAWTPAAAAAARGPSPRTVLQAVQRSAVW